MTERKQISLQKDNTQAALDALAFVCRTLGWLEVVPPYGDAVSRTKECDTAIKQCETIRAALTAQDVNAELLERAKALVKYCEWQINEGTDHHPTLPSAIVSAKEAIARAEQKGGV